MGLWSRKNLAQLQRDATEEGHGSLRRVLSAVNLTLLGIGGIIGAGIFVLTGTAAAKCAGPAIVLSFILAGLGCLFAGLCYAELAAMIPVAGSAYTYAYATLGEMVAWIIGWDLILEYLFGAATVAVGWSGYVTSFLADIGINVPAPFANAPGTQLVLDPTTHAWTQVTAQLSQTYASQGINMATLPHAVGVFNIVAAIAIALVTILLVVGIKESANFNAVIVMIKLFVVMAFILAGAYF